MSSEIANLFRSISLGVHVIATARQGRREAFTAASLMQVSYRPLLLALAVSPEHRSYALLRDGRGFAVSVLREDQMALAARFGAPAGEIQDKFAGTAWRHNASGLPVLDQAIASFDCELLELHPAGDHHLALARVRGGLLGDARAVPLRYFDTGDLDGSSALFPAAFG